MHIFLDGKAVEADGWTIRTVGELVQHLGNLPEFKHRIVQSIAVGGLELHVWEGNSAVALPQDAQIHVKTQSVAEVQCGSCTFKGLVDADACPLCGEPFGTIH